MACQHCTPIEPMTRKSGYVGRTADGDRVWLELELREMGPREAGSYVTVNHEAVDRSLEFSGGYVGISKGQRVVDFSGRSAALRKISQPVGSWTAEDLRETADIIDRWHLNGMRAGCAHQDKGLTADDGLASPPCPVNGYKWGFAWLVEPLPTEVVERIRELAAKLDGDCRD